MTKKQAKKKVIKAEIISNKKVIADHFVAEIASDYLARSSSPGQFVSVKVLERTTDPLLRIPLGIHSIKKNSIKLLYKVVGEGTSILSSKKKGEMMDILGPLGNGFDLDEFYSSGDKRAVVMAGGHGIAPLYALAEELLSSGCEVDFFIGVCEKKHILCDKELRKLGAKIHIATECGKAGHKGYVTELLGKQLERIAGHGSRSMIFACGPRPMLAALSKDAKRFNIPAQVSLDAYMACGIGACLGCAVRTTDGYKMVCKDGPVFDAQEIDWKKEGRWI